MIDIKKANMNMKRQWAKFIVVLVLYLVFLLWGSYAIRKGSLVDSSRHLVLTSPHPSPLSSYRGFFGNHHFTLCNDYLIQHGQQPILW